MHPFVQTKQSWPSSHMGRCQPRGAEVLWGWGGTPNPQPERTVIVTRRKWQQASCMYLSTRGCCGTCGGPGLGVHGPHPASHRPAWVPTRPVPRKRQTLLAEAQPSLSSGEAQAGWGRRQSRPHGPAPVTGPWGLGDGEAESRVRCPQGQAVWAAKQPSWPWVGSKYVRRALL